MARTTDERHGRGSPRRRLLRRTLLGLVVLQVCAVAAAVTAYAERAAAADGQSGALDVCKRAGGGVAAGDVFEFRVERSAVVLAFPVPAGQCVSLAFPHETAALTKGFFSNRPDAVAVLLPSPARLVVDGAALSAAQVQAVLRRGHGVSASSPLLLNLTQQLLAADLNVLRGIQPPAEVTEALDAANAGIQVGSAGGQITLETTLTPSQLSGLVDVLTAFNEGKKAVATPAAPTVVVAEVPRSDALLASIGCTPDACVSVDLAGSRAIVAVPAGSTSTVAFTNRSTTHGTLRLCKTAGTGIATGTTFRFATPAGERQLAAGGACAELVLPEVNTGDSDGHYRISEYGCGPLCLGGDQGFALASISCDPGCVDRSLGVGQAVVDVVAGELTSVTFTNRSTRGTLRLCKAAGTGIAPGTSFSFSTPAGTRVLTADGACAELVLPEVNTGDSDGHYRISEYGCGPLCLGGDQGFALASITCSPGSCVDTSLGVGQAVVDVVGGQTTTVTFTNRTP